jgi:DNA polymerase-3 subunit delta'
MPFRGIRGHRAVISLLQRGIARDRLPPSLIFAGAEGLGKRRVAVALAEAANCVEPVDGDACGVCRSCRRIARGVHGDVLLVQPDEMGSIKTAVVRDVVERSAYRPFEGRRRVVIFDDADLLETHAQNALLKTLEEPPSGSWFVLVTAQPDRLLPTVRSRCPALRFGPVPEADVAAALVGEHGWDERAARAAAAASGGSIGRALAMASEETAGLRDAAIDALAGVARADARRRLEHARELAGRGGGTLAAERDDLARRLHALSSVLRDVEAISSRADARLLANPDVRPRLEALATAYGGGRARRAFSAVDRALGALEGNASPKIVADWLLFQL